MTETELFAMLAEGFKIADFHVTEVSELQRVLALLLWDYSGAPGTDKILADVSLALGASIQRVRDFNEEDH